MEIPTTKPNHWNEDTWGEVLGIDGYGDGWTDVGAGAFSISGGPIDGHLAIRAENVFDAIEQAYAKFPGYTGYFEVEGFSSE